MHYSPRSPSVTKQPPGHPYLHLAGLIVKGRRDLGITRGRLAQMIGCLNTSKTARRIFDFESGERFDTELLSRITSALGIPRQDIELAWLSDWMVLHRHWMHWIDERIQQCVIVAADDIPFHSIALRRHLPILRSAEHYAAHVACHFRQCVCLVFSRRVASCLDYRGRLISRVEALPHSLGEEFMHHGGYEVPGWSSHCQEVRSAQPCRYSLTDRFGRVSYSNK